jgi:hypothetical protein
MRPFPRNAEPDEINRWWAENSSELSARSIAAGADARPITTWAQVAEFVDESTWERILGDLAPASLAEALAARPVRSHRHLSLVPDPEESP